MFERGTEARRPELWLVPGLLSIEPPVGTNIPNAKLLAEPDRFAARHFEQPNDLLLRRRRKGMIHKYGSERS
jgi:hypothetical protein